MTRRRFTREYKLVTVRLVSEQNLTVAEAARNLDIGMRNPKVFRGR